VLACGAAPGTSRPPLCAGPAERAGTGAGDSGDQDGQGRPGVRFM